MKEEINITAQTKQPEDKSNSGRVVSYVPCYDRENIKIYKISALTLLDSLTPGSCDIFFDPPYNVGKDYGEYKDNLPDQEYLEWMEQVLLTSKRVAKHLTVYIPKKWNLEFWNILGKEFQEIILSFNPAGAIRSGYSNQFNKLLTNAKPRTMVKNVWHNLQQPGLGYFFREDKFNHPGYTSYDITKRVVNWLCDSDLIADPFCGTGTTLLAAKELGRKAVGSEINEDYINIARSRLSQTRMPFD